jgi:hypothetical protein
VSPDVETAPGHAGAVGDSATESTLAIRPATEESKKRSAAPGAAAASSVAQLKPEQTAVEVRLELRDPGGVSVGTLRFRGFLDQSDRPVAVTVANGVIVAVHGQDEDGSDMASGKRPGRSLLGVAVEGVPDGRYLVVETDDPAP